MPENGTEKSFSFIEGTSKVVVDGVAREVEFNDNWQDYQPEGYRWRTLVYENTDKSKEDAAIVNVRPGGKTPVQINLQSEKTESKHRIWDVHLSGGATLLICRKGEKPQVIKFGKGENIASRTNLIEQGTIICWFADSEQDTDVTLFESEIPGFESANIKRVDEDATEIQGQIIPQEFWEIFHKLDTGKRFNPDGTAIDN